MNTNASTLRACTLALLVAACGAVPLLGCDGPGFNRPEYGPMFDDVEQWVWDNGYADGVWQPDWDDAPFYGPAFYSRVGWQEGRSDYQGRALEGVERNLTRAEAGIGDPSGTLIEDISAILYGTLGVIEYMAATGDMILETVDDVLDLTDGMLELLGDYAEGHVDYATLTYGPTSVTAVFAMAQLQYAYLLDTDRKQERIDRGRTLADRVEELAWNDTGSFYQFEPDNADDLFLYPNVAMMIVMARLYQLTGEDRFLGRAEEVFDGIQPLRAGDRPGYHSPYSAVTMGAQTDDYTTLSSTNYLMLALALLTEATGDEVYREEIDVLLEFIEGYLWVDGDGRVYHHWMDGRLAVPDDPEYYCIGCNLQLLYIIWWVHANLA